MDNIFLSIALGTLLLKIRIGERVEEASRSTDHDSPPYLTLMDFQNISTYFPRLKKPDSEITFKKIIKNEISVVDVLQLVSTNAKVVMGDCLITCFKSLITGVKWRDFENFEQLSNSFKELLWYLSPHLKKLSARSPNICDILKPLALLNDPTRHAHKVGNISQEVLLSFVDAVNTHLEKPYTSHSNFKPVHNVIRNVVEISVKFSDYQAKNIMVDHHSNEEEPEYKKTVFSLPELETIDKYTTQRETYMRNIKYHI